MTKHLKSNKKKSTNSDLFKKSITNRLRINGMTANINTPVDRVLELTAGMGREDRNSLIDALLGLSQQERNHLTE